ncbi:MAG: hypothetical protein ACOYJ5_00760 [Acutalibacteraceae bacterium]
MCAQQIHRLFGVTVRPAQHVQHAEQKFRETGRNLRGEQARAEHKKKAQEMEIHNLIYARGALAYGDAAQNTADETAKNKQDNQNAEYKVNRHKPIEQLVVRRGIAALPPSPQSPSTHVNLSFRLRFLSVYLI